MYGENTVVGNRQDSNGADIVDDKGNPIPALYEDNCTFTGTTAIYILGGTLKDGEDDSTETPFVYTPSKYNPNVVYVNGVKVTE